LDNNQLYNRYSGVWREFESSPVRDKFRAMGVSFFDLSRAPLSHDNNNFVDSYHPSEMGMLRSLQTLLLQPQFKEIFPSIDPEAISRKINEAEQSKQRFDVYGG
jgi:hypothetical protein